MPADSHSYIQISLQTRRPPAIVSVKIQADKASGSYHSEERGELRGLYRIRHGESSSQHRLQVGGRVKATMVPGVKSVEMGNVEGDVIPRTRAAERPIQSFSRLPKLALVRCSAMMHVIYTATFRSGSRFPLPRKSEGVYIGE